MKTGREDGDDDPDPPHQHAVAVTHPHHAQGVIPVLDVDHILDGNRHQKKIGDGDRASAQGTEHDPVVKPDGGLRKDQINDQKQQDQGNTADARAGRDGHGLLPDGFL